MKQINGKQAICRQIILPLTTMTLTAVLSLLLVSLLSYIYKWQADKALVGITLTYIVTGLAGGFTMKKLSKETDTSKKLIEGIIVATLFMLLLIGCSICIIGNPFTISGRFIMIWMLLIGSSCLGRIL